jgi:hypothetical protein
MTDEDREKEREMARQIMNDDQLLKLLRALGSASIHANGTVELKTTWDVFTRLRIVED